MSQPRGGNLNPDNNGDQNDHDSQTSGNVPPNANLWGIGDLTAFATQYRGEINSTGDNRLSECFVCMRIDKNGKALALQALNEALSNMDPGARVRCVTYVDRALPEPDTPIQQQSSAMEARAPPAPIPAQTEDSRARATASLRQKIRGLQERIVRRRQEVGGLEETIGSQRRQSDREQQESGQKHQEIDRERQEIDRERQKNDQRQQENDRRRQQESNRHQQEIDRRLQDIGMLQQLIDGRLQEVDGLEQQIAGKRQAIQELALQAAVTTDLTSNMNED